MRLLLFLLFLPFLTFSQTTIPDSTTNSRWRLGLAVQLDNGYKDPYALGYARIIPKVDRPDAIHFLIDFSPFRKLPYLWLNAEVGYYEVSAGNDDFRWLEINQWPDAYFSERTEMNYWHGGLGLSVEPFAEKRFSPYLGGQLLIVAPTRVNYRFLRFDLATSELVDDIRLNSGERWVLGWEANVGFRARLTQRINAAFGFYHAYIDYQADWPELPQRSFSDAIMRLDGGGIELRCQYRL